MHENSSLQPQEVRVLEDELTSKDLIDGALGVICQHISHRDPVGIRRLRIELSELIARHVGYKPRPESLKEAWWKEKEKTKQQESSEEPEHDNLGTLVVDVNGGFWKWNCGWWLVDRRGRYRIAKPLTHRQFKGVPKAERVRLDTLLNGSRPYGEWRRYCQDHRLGTPVLYHHERYKHVRILASDGVHAIVQNYYDSTMPKHEVMFSNLTELKITETRKSMAHKEKNALRKEKNPKQIEVTISPELLKELLK